MAAIKELKRPIYLDGAKFERALKSEVKALQDICKLGLLHVVEIAAMIAIGTKQYLLYPWAGGGNLADLWRSRDSYRDRSVIAGKHIPAIVHQLVGLAGALEALHTFGHGNSASYRHGDLKPENILVFDINNPSLLGVWKIADLGLAKYHMVATGDRVNVSSDFGAGTISYQPPESFRLKAAPTSRLYDIWSMGCIILQIMTWLLYGTDEISELTIKTKSAFTSGQSSYWTATSWNETFGYHNVKIHSAVKTHMKQMKLRVKGSRALQELLCVIEEKLLVVQLPPNATTTKRGCRTNAADLHQSLQKIEHKRNYPGYWKSGYNVAKQAKSQRKPQAQKLGAMWRSKVSFNFLMVAERTISFLLFSYISYKKLHFSFLPRGND